MKDKSRFINLHICNSRRMKIILSFLLFCCCAGINAQSPKIIADGTITFSIFQIIDGHQTSAGSKIIYLKGKFIRTDLITPKFSQSVFYDSKEGNATVMKNIGQSKYISYYSDEEWKMKNEIFKNNTLSLTGKSKSILNYNCKEAELKLTNGNIYTIYFTTELMPSIDENPYEFENVPGLVLEYKSKGKNGNEIIYVAEKIDFDPVPSAQFQVSEKGYRLLKE